MTLVELLCQQGMPTVLPVMPVGLLQVVNGIMAQSQQRGPGEAPITALGVLPLVRKRRLGCSSSLCSSLQAHNCVHNPER
jgi:hypothetical protein